MLLLLYDVPIKFTNRPRIFIESMSMFLLFFFCVFIWCIQCYLLVVFGFFKNNTQTLWNFVMTTFFFLLRQNPNHIHAQIISSLLWYVIIVRCWYQKSKQENAKITKLKLKRKKRTETTQIWFNEIALCILREYASIAQRIISKQRKR